MTTLGQIVGIQKGVSVDGQQQYDAIYHALKRKGAFTGAIKEHTAFEGHLAQPTNVKHVEENATALLLKLRPILTRWWDLEATKDSADQTAHADVVIGRGTENEFTILDGVPISHLLFLDRKLSQLLGVLKSVPVIEASKRWTRQDSDERGLLRTEPRRTPSTSKETGWEVVVQQSANGPHPADVRQVSKDIQTGEWDETHFTTALRPDQKDLILLHVTELLEGVKQAIPIANQMEITDVREGERLFNHIFTGVF